MSNLVLHQKTYDFALYLFKISKYFPKSIKFTLSQKLTNKILDFLGMIERANILIDKKEALLECRILFGQFKVLLRLSYDCGYLKPTQYGYCCIKIAEIGKILGGWIKIFG